MVMKKIISGFLLVFLVRPGVLACVNPVIKNEYNVPINIYGGLGFLSINGTGYEYENYPYPLIIENRNSENLIVNMTPYGTLSQFIAPVNVEIPGNDEVSVDMLTLVTSGDKAGKIIVSGFCEGGFSFPEGQINVYIISADSSGGTCDGTITSCGIWPNCYNIPEDFPDDNTCVNGYKRSYSCEQNQVVASDLCTNYCCTTLYGEDADCQDNVCIDPYGSQPIDFSLNVNDGSSPVEVEIRIYESGQATPFHSSTFSGLQSFTSAFGNVDLELSYGDDNLVFTFENLNLSYVEDQTVDISITEVASQIGGVDVHRSFDIQVGSVLYYDDIELVMRYSDLSYENEDYLRIYRCSNYDESTDICQSTWQSISPSKDNGNLIVNVEGLSVFSIIEDNDIGTTTVPTTTSPDTTTSPSSGSGGSSGGSGSSGGGGSSTGTTTVETTNVTPQTPVNQTSNGSENTTANVTPEDPEDENTNILVLTGKFIIDSLTSIWVWIVGGLALVGLGFVGLKFYRERKEKQMIASEFSNHISEPGPTENEDDFVEVRSETPKPKVKTRSKSFEIKEASQITDAKAKVIDDIRKRAREMDEEYKK
jgi:hypothetical protein